MHNCIKVLKKDGEFARRALVELNVLDNSLKIESDYKHIYFPINEFFSNDMISKIPNATCIKKVLEIKTKLPTLENLIGFIPKYEIIGDIAIIDKDIFEKKNCKIDNKTVANAILKVHPNIKTVLNTLTHVIGEYRTREFEVIAGEKRYDTVHKEYGCQYMVDLSKVYFTPRLSTERMRVLSYIHKDDMVVDMFAGVGPYSILIAKKKGTKVIAIDKNSYAIEFLKKNAILNSVELDIIEGDAKKIANMFLNSANHVIMNLPHNANEFLDAAIKMIKKGGTIHYYDITYGDNLFNGSIEIIKNAADKINRLIEVIDRKIVRSYSPNQYNVCIEVKIY